MDRLQEGDTGAFITCDHLCVRVAGLQPLPPSPPSRFGALPFPQKRPRLLPPGWPPEAPPNDLPPRRVAFAAAFAAAPGTSAGVRAGFGFHTEVKAPRLSILATVTFTLQSARHVHSAVPPAPLCTSEPLLPRAALARRLGPGLSRGLTEANLAQQVLRCVSGSSRSAQWCRGSSLVEQVWERPFS